MTSDEQSLREEEIERQRARIAELEQAAAAHELDLKLAAVIKAMPDAVGLATSRGEVIFVNGGFRQMAGLEEDEPLAASIAAYHSEAVSKMVVEQAMPAAVQHGVWIGEIPFLKRDGKEVPTSAVVLSHKDKDGDVEFLTAIFRDASAQKAAENELECFFNLNADLFTIMDFDGRTRRLNPAWERTLGYSHAELISIPLLKLVHPDDIARTKEMVRSVVSQSNSNTIVWENRFRHKDGNYRWLEWRSFASVSEQRIYAIGRDITDRKWAEETIQKQSAALLEVSTPLIPISNEIVVMPLVGTLDSRRIAQVMDTLLEGIGKMRAKVAILDITGVPVVDTQVASALLKAAKAVSLLGAEAVLTGIRPFVAQTLVTIGADLSTVMTCGTLQAGIAYAMRNGQGD